MKPSQIRRIVAILKKRKCIYRNYCLDTYPRITRLTSRITDLKNAGWKFHARYTEDRKDFVYIVQKMPKEV